MFGKKSSQTYVIFSPMHGVLMQDGKLLSHTKIIRRLRWNGNDEEGLVEEFMTDETGRFSLPIHEVQLSPGMLSQFVGKADLEVETNNGIDTIWFSSKLMPEVYSETGEPLSELVCDTEVEEVPVFIGGNIVPNIITKCRWKNMPDN